MAVIVSINALTGTSPYDVYICQSDGTSCFYMSRITNDDLPYVFEIPPPYDNSNEYLLKVVDASACILTGTSAIFFTQTPTPSPTSTPTVTPTNSPTITNTPSTTATNTATVTQTPTTTQTQTPSG
jgi:hypothetical protein